MMSFDRTPSGPMLDSAVAAELRAVLARSLESGVHSEELKTLLTRAAVDARAKGILAEQLLLTLKEVWYSLPRISTQSGSEIQTRLLQQLIARCIQEYYEV